MTARDVWYRTGRFGGGGGSHACLFRRSLEACICRHGIFASVDDGLLPGDLLTGCLSLCGFLCPLPVLVLPGVPSGSVSGGWAIDGAVGGVLVCRVPCVFGQGGEEEG